MALTNTIQRHGKMLSHLAKFVDVTCDSSYATGGYSLTAADLGLQRIDFVDAGASGGYVPEYNYSTNKLLVRWSGGSGAVLSQVTNATDLSAVTFRLYVLGV